MRTARSFFRWMGLVAALVVAASFSFPQMSTAQPDRPGETEHATQSGQLAPDAESDFSAQAAPVSEAERAALGEKLLERREEIASRVDNQATGRQRALPQVQVPETRLADASEAPGDLIIGRNNRNTVAQTVSSTLAEPAAANEGLYVFYSGNTYTSYSTNGGVTWTNAGAFPAGPASAPTVCCDPDVIYDTARAKTYSLILYLNASATNGAVRIFVRDRANLAPQCSYTITVGTNVVPDYPHLGLSNRFVYLTTNNVGANWVGAQVRRFDAAAMAACGAVPFNTFTYGPNVPTGQRVFVPVEGAREMMYWGQLETTSSFRVFRWPESSTVVSSFTRAISTSAHNNPDCRGGTGNFDWIERSTAFSITGFRMRGGVGAGRVTFYWNASPIGSFTQAHVRAAVFRESDLALIQQPHIFNNGFCIGFPAVGVSDWGYLGISLAAGGKAGGGGTAAQGYVGIVDDFNFPNIGAIFLTASGTHNRSDARFGDYFTSRRQSPCGLWFAATNYALLNGNTSPSHVNARYVEFGRDRERRCYEGWRDEVR